MWALTFERPLKAAKKAELWGNVFLSYSVWFSIQNAGAGVGSKPRGRRILLELSNFVDVKDLVRLAGGARRATPRSIS